MRGEKVELAELVYLASVYRQRRFHSEAIDLLTKALSAGKDGQDSNSCAIVQYSLAKVYEEQGNDFFAKKLYGQALSDWLGGRVSPLDQILPFRTLRSIERACQQLIQQVEQRSEIQNLPLPTVSAGNRALRAG